MAPLIYLEAKPLKINDEIFVNVALYLLREGVNFQVAAFGYRKID